MNKKDEKKPSGDVRRTKLTLSVTAAVSYTHLTLPTRCLV